MELSWKGRKLTAAVNAEGVCSAKKRRAGEVNGENKRRICFTQKNHPHQPKPTDVGGGAQPGFV